MTASIIGADAAPVSSSFGRFAGVRQLVRKDATEWVRSRRIWVILATVTTFLVLTAANSRIVHLIAPSAGSGESPRELPSLGPTENLVGALATQMFVIAAIFVAGSLLARERESGTLAWVASKPVTRASIWASKWISSTAILSVVAGLIPLAITAAVVTLLYGAPPVGIVIGLALGLAAVTAFFVALGLALGTVIPGQAATIATTLTIFALMPMIAGAIPDGMSYIPTTMVTWPAAAIAGEAVPMITPVIWFASTVVLMVLAIRRIGRIEL